MACYKPLTAYQCADRSIIWREIPGADVVRTLSLPCGQCVGCRLERSRQWAVRCMHEAQMHTSNCFITLTFANFSWYDAKKVKFDIPYRYHRQHSAMDLIYDEYQLFMKRFRKRFPDFKIRFYMAGEYGESFDRPHYHACIFGFDFPDKKFLSRTSTGSILYTSKILEELWPYGYSSIGDVNFESAAYVARYIMKKQTGKVRLNEDGSVIDPEQHYEFCDLLTGELFKRTPEFNKMSLKPGIGQAWFDKFMSDVYTTDSVVVRGKKCRPPRFYDNKFKELFPEEFDGIQFKRELEGRSRFEDNTLERLAVKEKVALAKLSLLKRKI
jgi:hypothetical protein